MKYFGQIFSGLKSLLIGMAITFREMLRTLFTKKAVTLQYPHEKPVLSPAFRSCIRLIKFEETKSHDCVGCLACERICPSYCIEITGGRVEGIKKKRADTFIVDFALCSLCGLCLDVCPTDTLEYAKMYDEAGYERVWKYDLMEEFRVFEPQFRKEQAVREEKEAEVKKAAKAKKAAAAKAAKEAKPAAAVVAATKAPTPAETSAEKDI